MEKNRTNQTKNSRGWGVLGKARQTGRGCISQDEMSSKRDGRKQGKLSGKKRNTKGLKIHETKNDIRVKCFGRGKWVKVEKHRNFAH